ncbi:MAG: exodeoxyribonuclease VII large subunit [Bacteroidota bacterium]|nr:exodeoxyribonuclease VII large subunit [Bacteroidota bacterium]
MNERIFTLSEITRRIEEIFRPHTINMFWVRAEVATASFRGGHFYATLVETEDGKQKAKMECVVWKRELDTIQSRFQAMGLTFEPRQGSEVCLKCRLTYHQVYGLRLQGWEADPVFALGELEKRKRALIDKLVREGFDRKNKSLTVPLLPRRIGIVTSIKSAAYSDIVKTLRDGGYGFILLAADALMQGENTEESVCHAFDVLERLEPDVILLARGGGNRTDLAWLDSEPIALRIASCRMPVWSAIGHETDLGVPDIVAHTSFKTPTAVAEEIVSRYRREELRVRTAVDTLWRVWDHRRSVERAGLDDDIVGIRQGTRKLMQQSRTALLAAAEKMHALVVSRLADRSATVRSASRGLQTSTLRRIVLAKQWNMEQGRRLRDRSVRFIRLSGERLLHVSQRLRFGPVRERLASAVDRCEDRLRAVQAHDPRAALRRGYAIVRRPPDRIITRAALLEPPDDVRLEFFDGTVHASIIAREQNT